METLDDIIAGVLQSRGGRTANLSPEAILATKLRNPNALPDITQPVTGRPDINALYGQMETLTNTPPDFSKLDAVNKASQAASQGNFLQGLGMQMFGGKTMSPTGRALAADAIERSKPIRPNAADIGWTNEDTGEFVQNPVMERNQKERIITGRIDALVKEQERNAANLLALGKLDDARAARENAEQLKLIMAGIASGNQQLLAELTRAKIGELNRRNTGEPLPNAAVEGLINQSQAYKNLSRSADTFKDEFSQGLGGKLQVAGQNVVSSMFPEARNKIVTNPAERKRLDDQAAWWRDNEKYNVMEERHGMFGSAFTPGERQSWNMANIQPGMLPAEIRKNMAIRQKILEDHAALEYNTHINNKKRPGAVRAALGGFPGHVFGDSEDDLLDAAIAKKARGE